MNIHKPNMAPNKTPMPVQPVVTRLGNTWEVESGYTAEQASTEAGRCMSCPERYCAESCPVGTSIPEFIEQIRAGDVNKAYEIICSSNPLAGIGCRVCPCETQCESNCTRGIKGDAVAIGRLERFVCDTVNKDAAAQPVRIGCSAAVVGSGPAGLVCAITLAKAGVKVTIFEKANHMGGVLAWGIPPFILPGSFLKDIIREADALGVEFRTGAELGRDVVLKDLQARYDAVFLSVGAGKAIDLGEKLPKGAMQAADYLAMEEKPSAAVVAVFGGGSTAIDAARAAVRSGAKRVYLLYRRTEAEMPVTKDEFSRAREEGVEMIFLANPAAYLTEDGKLKGVECQKMLLDAPEYPGGRRSISQSKDRFSLKADLAVLALGFENEPLDGVDLDSLNRIKVDGRFKTSAERVYAGGDAVTGPGTVMKAAAAGRAAAKTILEQLVR